MKEEGEIDVRKNAREGIDGNGCKGGGQEGSRMQGEKK